MGFCVSWMPASVRQESPHLSIPPYWLLLCYVDISRLILHSCWETLRTGINIWEKKLKNSGRGLARSRVTIRYCERRQGKAHCGSALSVGARAGHCWVGSASGNALQHWWGKIAIDFYICHHADSRLIVCLYRSPFVGARACTCVCFGAALKYRSNPF